MCEAEHLHWSTDTILSSLYYEYDIIIKKKYITMDIVEYHDTPDS